MRQGYLLESAGKTDIGRRRKRNEDDYLIMECGSSLPSGGQAVFLCAVADGIGGHAAGDVASRMACEALGDLCRSLRSDGNPDRLRSHLSRTFHEIDHRIGSRAAKEDACAHMGTTLSALAVADGHAVVVHVGDSRIYRLRNRRLDRLTVDHTFVQDLISYGELAVDQAAVHPLRNMLTNALGTEETLEEIYSDVLPIRSADRFLLCTDGLHDMVGEGRIAEILGRPLSAKGLASALVDEANANGGRDNVTAVVLRLRSVQNQAVTK